MTCESPTNPRMTQSISLIFLPSYMRPGTPHAVLTLEPSIAIGGHFYSTMHFKRTLYSLVYEHLCGDFATNTANTRAPSLLFRTFMSLDWQLSVGTAQENGTSNLFLSNCLLIIWTERFPDCVQFAWLIVCIAHMNQLEPKVQDVAKGERWIGLPQFKADYEYIVEKMKERVIPRWVETFGQQASKTLWAVEEEFVKEIAPVQRNFDVPGIVPSCSCVPFNEHLLRETERTLARYPTNSKASKSGKGKKRAH